MREGWLHSTILNNQGKKNSIYFEDFTIMSFSGKLCRTLGSTCIVDFKSCVEERLDVPILEEVVGNFDRPQDPEDEGHRDDGPVEEAHVVDAHFAAVQRIADRHFSRGIRRFIPTGKQNNIFCSIEASSGEYTWTKYKKSELSR